MTVLISGDVFEMLDLPTVIVSDLRKLIIYIRWLLPRRSSSEGQCDFLWVGVDKQFAVDRTIAAGTLPPACCPHKRNTGFLDLYEPL
jgi:hypothetical protein